MLPYASKVADFVSSVVRRQHQVLLLTVSSDPGDAGKSVGAVRQRLTLRGSEPALCGP